MPLEANNITETYLSKTKEWVDSGMTVEGIPFMNRLKIHEWTFYQWEQVSFDVVTCVLLCLVLAKLYSNTKITNFIEKDIHQLALEKRRRDLLKELK